LFKGLQTVTQEYHSFTHRVRTCLAANCIFNRYFIDDHPFLIHVGKNYLWLTVIACKHKLIVIYQHFRGNQVVVIAAAFVSPNN
jgi:hypothetical protein